MLYDRLLHYICNADGIKPPKTEEQLKQEELDRERELLEQEEPEEEEVSESDHEDIQPEENEGEKNTFTSNFFVGGNNPAHLDSELQKFRKRYGYRIDDLVMYKMTFHHVEDFTDARFEHVKFTYLLKTDKTKTWEDVYTVISGLQKAVNADLDCKDKPFKVVEWEYALVPQRQNEDGTFDNNDLLHVFKEGEKRKSTSILVQNLRSMKLSSQDGLFYSLRFDTLDKDGHRHRERIEFPKPALPEQNNEDEEPYMPDVQHY